MRALRLLLLLTATYISPTLLIAEGLPPVWETSDWSDKNSLWITKPEALFVIRGAGNLEGWISQEPTYDFPPAISVLGDDAFLRALFRDSKAANANATEEEIQRKIAEYKKRFSELISKIWKMQDRDKRLAEVDAFERESKALLSDLQGRLTPAQRERCERRFASAYFYRYGPIQFARRFGASERELTEIASNVRELREPLRTQLRELETATYLEVLDKLEGDGVEEMRKLVASASPKRYGVIFTLHHDLANFDAPPVPVTKGTSTHMKRNRLSDAGAPLLEKEVPTDPFTDFIYLFSVQELNSRDREIAGSFIKLQFEEAELTPDSEVNTLKSRASELYRKSILDKNADQFDVYAELAEVQNKIADLLNGEVDAAVRVMSDDGRRAIEQGRLILLMQRYGCTSALASRFAHDRFGLSIEAASWQALDAVSAELAAALRDRSVAIQQEYVKNVYRETSLARRFEDSWVRTADEDYPPMLEMLVVHADEAAK